MRPPRLFKPRVVRLPHVWEWKGSQAVKLFRVRLHNQRYFNKLNRPKGTA